MTAKPKKLYLAINQYGTKEIVKNPRKDLMAKYGKNVSKMYVDAKKNKIMHTGYVVNKNWFELYELTPFRKKVK